GQARWTLDKRKQRGLGEVPLPEGHEGLQLSESDVVEKTIDLQRIMQRWSKLALTVWQETSSGKTVRELGRELGIQPQRISEIRKRLLKDIESYLERNLRQLPKANEEDSDIP